MTMIVYTAICAVRQVWPNRKELGTRLRRKPKPTKALRFDKPLYLIVVHVKKLHFLLIRKCYAAGAWHMAVVLL